MGCYEANSPALGISGGRARAKGGLASHVCGQQLQVYYCRTLIREIELENQRSTMVERWFSSPTQHQKV
ncbi:MAG: hypothetical protein ACYDDS_16800 [Candidatus Sulfotelmatobacter sp.]